MYNIGVDNAAPPSLIKDVTIIAGLIGVAGTLLGVILGFYLKRIDKYWEEVEGFRIAKATLLATPLKSWLYPNLYPHLRQLRNFFIKHPKYLKQPENTLFFRKWLTDPILDTRLDTTHWKDELIEEMLKDLSGTKVWRLSRFLF